MNTANIELYVEQKNRFNGIFGGSDLSLLRPGDRQQIADMIDSDLSPENLSCDGEIPARQVLAKRRFLVRCAEELLSIDSTVRFYEIG